MTVISSKNFTTRQKKNDDDDDDAELLTLAESRMDDEFMSGQEFRDYLKSLPR